MPKTLSYADAVRLLGGEKSRFVSLLDTLTSGAMLVAAVPLPGVLSWFDAKAELARISHDLVRGIAERRSGLSRYGRTERLEAAHTVLAIVAFFEALAELELPITVERLELTRAEQLSLAGERVVGTDPLTPELLGMNAPMPRPGQPYARFQKKLTSYYVLFMGRLWEFVTGLSVWERLDLGEQAQFFDALHGELPPAALARHEALFGQLAADFPEVAFWAGLREHEGTRAEVRELGIALAGLERTLRDISVGRAPDERRAGLAQAYAAELDRPIVESGDVPTDLRVPTLGDAYVPPLCRFAPLTADARPADEWWWGEQPVRDDLPDFLTGYLTSSGATWAPLLVLGQPGSGKSVLTRVLAGRLPAEDFLVVRVVLRDVPAAADLQEQIEYAVRTATGERLDWPVLARSAGDALPVILLDGFDELLQATGVSQTDYLLRVAAFQRREADQGRPVAVVVTSRITVADRAQIPDGTVGLRLEPFDEQRVTSWLEIWNTTNADGFDARGIRPLAPETVLAHRELAEQPLLLLMLALYDADGNALRTAGELRRDELYERLLTGFARREVTKLGPGLPERELKRLVESELRRLSVVAFAMFNRGAQWIAEADLEADLATLPGLAGAAVAQPNTDAGLRAPLRPAEIVLGRFFFVHRSQASRDNARLETYEFLHATFGEYLIARLVWLALRDVLARDAAAMMSPSGGAVDDDLLHALLSFGVLSSRVPIIDFLGALLSTASDDERDELTDLLIRLFRGVHEARPGRRFETYQPRTLPVPARHAAYSANLLVLAVLAAGPLRGSQLYGDDDEVVTKWHAQALLWRSQCTGEEYASLVHLLRLERIWNGERRDIVLVRDSSDSAVPPVDLDWSYARYTNIEKSPAGSASQMYNQSPAHLRRRAHFECGVNVDVVQHVLEPLAGRLGLSINTVVFRSESVTSAAHSLLNAWLMPLRGATRAERERVYRQCADVVVLFGELLGSDGVIADYLALLCERLATDPYVPAALVAEILEVCTGRSVRRQPRAAGELAHALVLKPAPILHCGLAALGRDATIDRRIADVLVGVLPPVRAWNEVDADAAVRLHELGLHDFPLTGDEYDLLVQRLGRRRPDLVTRLKPLVRAQPAVSGA